MKKIKTRLNVLIRNNKRAEKDSWNVDTNRRDAYYASKARNHVNITTLTTPESKKKKDRPPKSDVLNPPLDAFNGPDGQYWLLAYELEMERLGVEVLGTYDGLEKLDTDKPIKSKFAFRRSVRPDGTMKFRCRLSPAAMLKSLARTMMRTIRLT